jgi:hypothetical protein
MTSIAYEEHLNLVVSISSTPQRALKTKGQGFANSIVMFCARGLTAHFPPDARATPNFKLQMERSVSQWPQ